MSKRAFSDIPINARASKPRSRGMTEIRGPYYAAVGPNYLEDIFQTMGEYVDGLKFSGGAFALMPEDVVRRITDLAHEHHVYVSTGGWVEHVITHGPDAVDAYVKECKRLGFDVVELSVGFISLTTDDLLRLVERVTREELKAKPELGIQFGAGGDTAAGELEAEGTRDAGWIVSRGRQCLDAGAEMIHIESEGITENVTSWRTDVVAQIMEELSAEKVMFEAAEPDVFEWYVKNYGPDVNLFVDHSQIVQLECLRSGLWGTKSTWGRIQTYRPEGN